MDKLIFQCYNYGVFDEMMDCKNIHKIRNMVKHKPKRNNEPQMENYAYTCSK